MALGYGYVKDAKPMQINWQEVGKQMTDNIQAEITDRQNRKDDIDKQLTQYNKDLLNQPQGTNAEVNRFMGDFSADAGEAMRNAERMLKSGNLSERDFYKFRANANQGTDLMFEAGKKFNEGYDESMRRFADGESQSKENWMRQQTEGFLAFANNGAYINPLTGEVNVARRYKDENGEWQISTKPGEFANASELVQQASAKYNKYDLDGSINKAIKGLGATLIKESSGLTTKQFFQAIQDGTLGDKEQLLLDKAKLNMVASFTANPNHVSSILTENMGFAPNGEAYTFTYDENKAKINENLILVNPDGTNNFTTVNGKKQLQAAKDFASAQFEAGLGGSREEAQDLTAVQKEELKLKKQRLALDFDKLNLEKDKFKKSDRDKATDLKTKAQVISTLYSGNIADINAAVDYYRDYGGNTNVLEVKRNDAGIVVTFEDENGNVQTRPVSFFTADSTSDTNVPNPDFDPSQPESETNQKLVKGRQLTEAQFVNAASQLLIGEDVSTEIKSRGDDGELLYNRALTSVDSPITATTTIDEGETLAQSETYNVSADQYFDNVIKTVTAEFSDAGEQDLGDYDQDLAAALNRDFKDIGLIALDTGGLNNEVNVRIPGITKTITIDTNNFTTSGDLTEIQKLREFITNAIKIRPDLQEKLKLKADVKKRGGRGSKYNKARLGE